MGFPNLGRIKCAVHGLVFILHLARGIVSNEAPAYGTLASIGSSSLLYIVLELYFKQKDKDSNIDNEDSNIDNEDSNIDNEDSNIDENEERNKPRLRLDQLFFEES